MPLDLCDNADEQEFKLRAAAYTFLVVSTLLDVKFP